MAGPRRSSAAGKRRASPRTVEPSAPGEPPTLGGQLARGARTA